MSRVPIECPLQLEVAAPPRTVAWVHLTLWSSLYHWPEHPDWSILTGSLEHLPTANAIVTILYTGTEAVLWILYTESKHLIKCWGLSLCYYTIKECWFFPFRESHSGTMSDLVRDLSVKEKKQVFVWCHKLFEEMSLSVLSSSSDKSSESSTISSVSHEVVLEPVDPKNCKKRGKFLETWGKAANLFLAIFSMYEVGRFFADHCERKFPKKCPPPPRNRMLSPLTNFEGI